MFASQENENTVIIMTCVFAVTYAWFIFFCYKTHHKPAARVRARKKTFDGHQRKTVKSRSMVNRLQGVYTDAKKLFDDNMLNALERSAHKSLASAASQKAITNYWVLCMSIMEKFDSLLHLKAQNQETSEQMKELGMTLAYTEGAKGEIDELLEEANDPEADLDEVTEGFDELTERLHNIAEEVGVRDRMQWDCRDENLTALEHKLQTRQHFTKGAAAEEEDDDSQSAQDEATLKSKLYHFFFREHPIFYGIFWVAFFSILLSHWVFVGSGKLRPGTFLSTPPQYSLGKSKLQDAMLPLVFGLMHCSLFLFGLIPVCFVRGLHRDLLKVAGFLRNYIPFDDMFQFHQMIGTMLIGCLFIASNIWLVMMGVSCLADDNQAVATAACTAFNPNIADAKRGDSNGEILFDSLPGANYFDPRDNVLFLREIVWLTWFFLMPLIHWRNRPSAYLPTWVRRNWWEVVYYIHLSGAVASICLALYARFEVFYPMLMGGWSFWFFDKTREAIFKTYHTDLLVDAARPADSSYHIKAATGQPTVLAARFRKPKHMDHGKGQWLYLQVPEIDRVWHPFSLASASEEAVVQLLIGIQGKWELRKNGEWVQPPTTQTWTYQLLQLFRENAALSLRTRQPQPIRVKLRGPYGSPFQKCFDPRYPAVVIIGAGTGLTSALSVLKEMIQLRRKGKVQKYVWFVWSCRRIDDLLMCWRAMHELLFEATKSGAIDMPPDWNPMTSVLLDWLSITIYVTQADKDQLLLFLDNSIAMVPVKAAPTEKKAGKQKSRFYRMMTFSGNRSAIQPTVEAAPPRPPKRGHRRVATGKEPRGALGRRPTYIPPPAFDETEEVDEENSIGMQPMGESKGGQARWKAALLRAELSENNLERTGGSLDNQNYGTEGDFLVREGSDGTYILIILTDPQLNQFEFHLLKKNDEGIFCIDGRDLRKKCGTIHSVIAHLSSALDHTSIRLRKSKDATSRAYMQRCCKELFRIAEAELSNSPDAEASAGSAKVITATSNPTTDISTWMKEQVLATSMDTKGAHIGRLFKWVRQFCSTPHNNVKNGANAPIAICFCGPAVLAKAIGKTAAEAGGQVEFSSEHI